MKKLTILERILILLIVMAVFVSAGTTSELGSRVNNIICAEGESITGFTFPRFTCTSTLAKNPFNQTLNTSSDVRFNELNISGNSFYYATIQVILNEPNPFLPSLNISNAHPVGASQIRLENNNGSNLVIAALGGTLGKLSFATQRANGQIDDSDVVGLSALNANIFILTTNNKVILIGGSPDTNLSNMNFTIKLDPVSKSLTFQGSKIIRPVPINGGFGLIFENEDPLVAGGVPFLFSSNESGGDMLLTGWYQVGRNNSFSGQMNSFGVVPKDWVTLGKEKFSGLEDSDFLFNISDYIKYCAYLQNNLSLVPDGCQFFADTPGRTVPLLFGGDLEVHREAVIHEGLRVLQEATINPKGGTFTVFNGTIVTFIERTEEIGVTSGDTTDIQDANFEGGVLSPYVLNTSVGANVWTVVNEIQCHDNLCASAGSNVDTEMITSINTLNLQSLNIHFYITETNLDGGDTFDVDVNNNTGSGWINIISVTDITGSTDALINASIPNSMDNISSLSIRFVVVTDHPTNEIVWVDDIIVNGTFIATTLVNVTQRDLKIQGSNPNIFILFNDSRDTWIFSPSNVSFEEVTQTKIITTEIELNGSPITDWSQINKSLNNNISVTSIQFTSTGGSEKKFTLEQKDNKGNVLVNITGNFTDDSVAVTDTNATVTNIRFTTTGGVQEKFTLEQTDQDGNVLINITANFTDNTAAAGSVTNNTGLWNLDINGTTLCLQGDCLHNWTNVNITYTATGTLLDLTGTVFSINEGTLTDENICHYESTGTQLECSYTLDSSGQCTGDICGGGHTHPASEVTAGSFPAGDFVFEQNDDAAAPTVGFGDGDSGLYETADDEINIATEGTDRIRINESGMGITGNLTLYNTTGGGVAGTFSVNNSNCFIICGPSSVCFGLGVGC